jgi:ketosteroid isomerase-like protein
MWQSMLTLPIATMRIETAEVGAGNDDTAWETGHYELIGNDGKVAETGKYVVIWKHDEAGWKIYRDIWNSNTPASSPALESTPSP